MLLNEAILSSNPPHLRAKFNSGSKRINDMVSYTRFHWWEHFGQIQEM